MRQLFWQFIRDETGTNLIEYGFIVTLISIGIIASLTSMGASVVTYLSEATAGIAAR